MTDGVDKERAKECTRLIQGHDIGADKVLLGLGHFREVKLVSEGCQGYSATDKCAVIADHAGDGRCHSGKEIDTPVVDRFGRGSVFNEAEDRHGDGIKMATIPVMGSLGPGTLAHSFVLSKRSLVQPASEDEM